MAIQNRRGIYSSGFDPTKLVPGEFAVVQSGDPDSDEGYSLYMCFTSGNVQRIALTEEVSGAGGSTVSWTPSLQSGTIIGTLTIDGTAYTIYAPSGGGGATTSDNVTNNSSVTGATVTAALNSLSDEIANVASGQPAPVDTASGMTDTDTIYLYVGSETGYEFAHWYYYNGSAWVDGGLYGDGTAVDIYADGTSLVINTNYINADTTAF